MSTSARYINAPVGGGNTFDVKVQPFNFVMGNKVLGPFQGVGMVGGASATLSYTASNMQAYMAYYVIYTLKDNTGVQTVFTSNAYYVP